MSVPSISNCRRNFAVWSKTGEEHPDYYKFVLRNGDIDSEWRSVNNFSNDQFLEDKPAYAGLVRTSHKHKKYDENVIVRNVGGQLVVDTDDRDDIYSLKEQRDSANNTLLVDLIRNNPNLAEQEEVKARLAELDARLPKNIPRRNEVLDGIIKDYFISRYKMDTQGIPSRPLISAEGTTIQSRLQRLVDIAVAEEQQAVSTVDIATAAALRQGGEQQTQEERITQEAIRRQGGGRISNADKQRLIDEVASIERDLLVRGLISAPTPLDVNTPIGFIRNVKRRYENLLSRPIAGEGAPRFIEPFQPQGGRAQ
jgi:alkylhydroperoxidase/carboxymuconolactone decarboxylase family protein YurZ